MREWIRMVICAFKLQMCIDVSIYDRVHTYFLVNVSIYVLQLAMQ